MPKYIHFVEYDPVPPRTTKTANVCKTGSGIVLGSIRWYGSWRQYVFYPEISTLFNKDCLRQIAEKCEEMTKAQLEIAKLRRENREDDWSLEHAS